MIGHPCFDRLMLDAYYKTCLQPRKVDYYWHIVHIYQVLNAKNGVREQISLIFVIAYFNIRNNCSLTPFFDNFVAGPGCLSTVSQQRATVKCRALSLINNKPLLWRLFIYMAHRNVLFDRATNFLSSLKAQVTRFAMLL